MSKLTPSGIEGIDYKKMKFAVEDQLASKAIFSRWESSRGGMNGLLSRGMRNQRVEELLKEGKKAPEIAVLLGISYQVTLRAISRVNLHSHLGKESKDWAVAVIEAFKEGKTVRELTAEFNVATKNIRATLNEAGLIPRSSAAKKTKKKSIDTPQSLLRGSSFKKSGAMARGGKLARNSQVEKLLKEGKKASEIAELLNISYVIALKAICEANIHNHLEKESEDWAAAVIEGFKEGKTVRELAMEFNVSTKEIRPVLSKVRVNSQKRISYGTEQIYAVHYHKKILCRVTVKALNRNEAIQKALSLKDVLGLENDEIRPIKKGVFVKKLGFFDADLDGKFLSVVSEE